MPKKRRKLDVVCLNSKCSCFNKKGLKNVVRNGKKANGVQNYKCTECGGAWLEAGELDALLLNEKTVTENIYRTLIKELY